MNRRAMLMGLFTAPVVGMKPSAKPSYHDRLLRSLRVANQKLARFEAHTASRATYYGSQMEIYVGLSQSLTPKVQRPDIGIAA